MTQEQLHVGQLLRNLIKSRKVAKSSLARAMQLRPHTIIYHTKSPNINCNVLWRYSTVLKHNLFADIAALLPKEFATTAKPDVEKDALIVALQEEVKLLRVERDVLKEVLGR